MSQKYDLSIYTDEGSDDEKETKKTTVDLNDDENDMNKDVTDNNPIEVDTLTTGDTSTNTEDVPQSQCDTATDGINHSTSIALTITTPSQNNNSSQKKFRKDFETKRKETSWEKVLLDAEEFESLMFSIRRLTARNRLQMLAKQMK